MWSHPVNAAGYQDPTTLFNESHSASSSSASSFSGGGASHDDDYRTLQNLFTAAPGLLSASPHASKWNKFHLGHQKRNSHHGRRHGHTSTAEDADVRQELTEAELYALEARRRQLREKHERRFFKERGALDFQRSVVFETGDAQQQDDSFSSSPLRARTATLSRTPIQNIPAASAIAESGAAESEVFRRTPPLPLNPEQGEDESDDDVNRFRGNRNGDCVPADLQAWYVASHASPAAAASSRTANRPVTGVDGHHNTQGGPSDKMKMKNLREGPERTTRADHQSRVRTQNADAEEESDKLAHRFDRSGSLFADPLALSSTPPPPQQQQSQFPSPSSLFPFTVVSAGESAVRSSGAGTTSVNMLWSRVAPSAELRQALRKSTAITTNTATTKSANSKKHKEQKHDRKQATTDEKRTRDGKNQKRLVSEQQGERTSPSVTPSNPFEAGTTSSAGATAFRGHRGEAQVDNVDGPFRSEAEEVGASRRGYGEDGGAITNHNAQFERGDRKMNDHDDAVVSVDLNEDDKNTDDDAFRYSDLEDAEQCTEDDEDEQDEQHLHAGPAVMTCAYADGGRPTLRAHRYVEQPNGIFIDHAHHADLLARYALEEQMRFLQEREDARRARRWNRLLHGNRAHTHHHSNNTNMNIRSNNNNNSSSSAAAAVRTRYHWLYDAATYRAKYVTILRYLQRVHVFLVSLAAGVSLTTLLVLTVPFPELKAGEMEDGLPRDVSAVVLLAMLNTSTSAAAAAVSFPTAQVLPILQQGSSVLALFLALLQPYHAALLLFLCLLLVITGFAPVSWGVSERYWMAQRRRWLLHDEATARREFYLATHSTGEGRPHASPQLKSPHSTQAYSSSDNDDRGEWSGSGGGLYSFYNLQQQQQQQQQSPFSRSFSGGSRSPHRKNTAYVSDHGGYTGRRPHAQTPPPRTRRLSSPTYFTGGGASPYQNARLGASLSFNGGYTSGGGGGGGYYYASSSSHQQQHPQNRLTSPLRGTYDRLASSRSNIDPLRNSVWFGNPNNAGGGGRSVSVADLAASYNYFSHNNNNNNNNASLNDLPSSSFLSYTRNAYSGGHNNNLLSGTATLTGLGYSPPPSEKDLSLFPSPYLNLSASSRNDLGVSSGSLSAAAAAAAFPGGFYNTNVNSGGAYGVSRPRGLSSSSYRSSSGQPRSVRSHPAGAGGAGSINSSARFGNALPPPLLLFPATTLEGRLSADNVFSRTFDYIQRRCMQWICNAIKYAFQCGGCRSLEGVRGADALREGDREDAGLQKNDPRRRYGELGSSGTLSAHRAARATLAHEHPAVPISLYLHVVLQPRLWCVVVALALTLVELAFTDERSVELLWRAQPSSWWTTTYEAQASDPQRGMGAGALPHQWLTAAFAEPSTGFDAVNFTATGMAAYSDGGNTFNVDSGRVGRVLLAVYATRTAMLWIAFLLNLFF